MDKAQTKPLFERKKSLQTKLEYVTQEMYRRNLELAETNKTLSLLRTIDELALESHESLEDFCNTLASSIAFAGEYPFVSILTRPPYQKQSLQFYGLNLSSLLTDEHKQMLHRVHISTHGNWFKSEEKSKVIRVKNFPHTYIKKLLNFSQPEFEVLENIMPPIGSMFIIKLSSRDKLVGLMAVGFLQTPDKIGDNEWKLFDRLSEAVGVALDNKLLFEENQHIVTQLQKTNEKLKELDESKDEFISMASHQLRTPLTSVKGYLSMVIDGDAGKLNKMQGELLDQAFVSSQRMVYLIADLLNVSRLKTGKFVIEAVQTNLADVVEGELKQLTETAKARNLELIYEKPKDFPLVMLDETKIRQVIMNFADNAIYYTPSGGHIRVELEDKDSTIEFRVVDDGLGVPKHEQQHLFGKFYRAGNARKARPDGTGLGLFMAKKVVIAQGGSIIFRSEEGKGSTFGFTFAKEKLKTLPPKK